MSTRAVHAGESPAVPGEPVVTPIAQTTTFYSAFPPGDEVRYTRYANNPNHQALARRLAALEGTESALVLGSGMAAIALTLLSLARAGEHVVAARGLYGGTLDLLENELPRFGIAVSFVTHEDEWREAIRPETRLLYVESMSNPLLRVPDLDGLAALARAHGLPLVVDATFTPPPVLRAAEHGAELVLHSATKYLGGHSDVTAGVVAGSAEAVERVRERVKRLGAVLDPHATWLLERGVKTLAVRVERAAANAMELARRLEGHHGVVAVHYPGLGSHPDHERAASLFSGFGAMVGVEVRGGDEAAVRMLQHLQLIRVAPSLGGVESLASMPRDTSHAKLSAAERRALGIEDGFVRLSIGIEDVDDLHADLDSALESALQAQPVG